MKESFNSRNEANAENSAQSLIKQYPEIVDYAASDLTDGTRKGLEDRFAQIEEDEQKDRQRPMSRKHTEEEYEQIRRNVTREAVEHDLSLLTPEAAKKLNDQFANIEWDEHHADPNRPKHSKEEYDKFRRDAVAEAMASLRPAETPATDAAPEAPKAETVKPAAKSEVLTPAVSGEKTTIAAIEGLNVTDETRNWLEGELAQIDWDERQDYEDPHKISHKHTKEEYERFRKEAVREAVKKDMRKLSKEARQRIKDETAQINEDEKKDYENPYKITHNHTRDEYKKYRRDAIAKAFLELSKKSEPEPEPKGKEDLKRVDDKANGDTKKDLGNSTTPSAPDETTKGEGEITIPRGVEEAKKEVSDVKSEAEDLEAKTKALEEDIAKLTAKEQSKGPSEDAESGEAPKETEGEKSPEQPGTNPEDEEAKKEELRARLKAIINNENIPEDIRYDARTEELLSLFDSSEELLARVEKLEKRAAEALGKPKEPSTDTKSGEASTSKKPEEEKPEEEDPESISAIISKFFKEENEKREAELAKINGELSDIETKLAGIDGEEAEDAEAIAELKQRRSDIERQVGIIDQAPLIAVGVDVTRDRNALAEKLARKDLEYRTKKRNLITRIWRTKLFPKLYSENATRWYAKGMWDAKVGEEELTVNELIARKSKGIIERFEFGAVDAMMGLSRNRLESDEDITEADKETTEKVRTEIEKYIERRPKDGENLEDLRRELMANVDAIVAEAIKNGKAKEGLRVGNYDEIAEKAYQRYHDYVEAAVQSRCKVEHEVAMAAVMSGFRLFFGRAHDRKAQEDALKAVESVAE